MVMTTDKLLDKIRRRAFIPASQSTFTDEELLEIASEELHGVIVPDIIKTREDYFVYKDSSSVLDGTRNQTFNIPNRAVGLQLREVSVTVGGRERNVPRLDIEDRAYQDAGGYIYGFDITSNQINLRGGNSGTLNLYYYLRPGALVKSTQARQVVSKTSNSVTLASFVSTWTASTKFDIVKATGGFDYRSVDLTVDILDSGTFTITFNEDLPTDAWQAIEVGDWVVESQYSPVPQIPQEWQEYLAEAVVAYIMESIGDSEGFQRAQARKEELRKNALTIISSRVDGESKKIVPRRNRINGIYDSKYRNY